LQVAQALSNGYFHLEGAYVWQPGKNAGQQRTGGEEPLKLFT